MILGHWPKSFRALYGGRWPDSYVTWDVETTGFSMEQDVIVEIAHCLVEGGKVTNALTLVLDWTDHPIVREKWLRDKMLATKSRMAERGSHYAMSFERMKAEGIRPERALEFYLDLFNTFVRNGLHFAAHNGVFDEEMFCYNLAGFRVCADGFAFGNNTLFDTNAIERANQLVGSAAALPRPGENMRAYFKRMKYVRGSALQSSLTGHCAAKYKFVEKYGVDLSQAHTAGFDAMLVHHLMEEFRVAHDAPVQESVDPFAGDPYPGPPARPVPPPPGAPTRRRGQRNR